MTRASTLLVAVGLSVALSACPFTSVTGPGGDLDAGVGSGRDGSSSGSDGASSGSDAATFPDAQAEAEGYLISDGQGNPATENVGNIPDGDPQSPCHIDIASFTGSRTFVRGGTNLFTGVVVDGMCDGMVIGIEELGGFYEVPLSSAEFSVFVSIGQDVTQTNLTLVLIPRLAVTESQPAGGYCQELRIPITVIQDIGSGDIQVSLSWSTDTDVDLHLVEPGGEEIYYGNLIASSGGELDLDSHPACNDPKTNNENITYQGVTPPSGHYIVRVDYWSACQEAGQTDFLVTVNLRGEPTVYQGSFQAGDATGGSAGDGVTVAEFDF